MIKMKEENPNSPTPKIQFYLKDLGSTNPAQCKLHDYRFVLKKDYVILLNANHYLHIVDCSYNGALPPKAIRLEFEEPAETVDSSCGPFLKCQHYYIPKQYEKGESGLLKSDDVKTLSPKSSIQHFFIGTNPSNQVCLKVTKQMQETIESIHTCITLEKGV